MWYRLVYAMAALVLLGSLPACQESSRQNQQDRYPWQITVLSDGSSRIFGIDLGVTSVLEAKQRLGQDPKVGLFENPNGALSLELFYKEFSRAGLSGRLVLTVAADKAELEAFKRSAIKRTKLESGVLQYRLDAQALTAIESRPVAAMTYVPYADLEEDVIVARFGEPAEKIRSHEQAQHWLYPDKGLDLIVNEVGKEILQYVPPAEFDRLVKPLRR